MSNRPRFYTWIAGKHRGSIAHRFLVCDNLEPRGRQIVAKCRYKRIAEALCEYLNHNAPSEFHERDLGKGLRWEDDDE